MLSSLLFGMLVYGPFAGAANGNKEVEEVVIVGSREDAGYRWVAKPSSTRMDASLHELPLSLQSVPREILDEQLSITLSDALRNVSGVSTFGDAANARESFIIRGFRLNDRSNYFRNGMRFNNALFSEMTSVERVEVLKGPASILFGGVEPGGVINIVSKPAPTEFSMSGRVELGSDEFRRARLDVGGPLNDNQDLRYRVNATVLDTGSFRDYVEAERVTVNPLLTWQVSEATEIGLEAVYLHDTRTPDGGIVVLGRSPADVPESRYLGNPGDTDETHQYMLSGRVDHQLTEIWQVRGQLSAARYKQDRFLASPEALNRGSAADQAYFNDEILPPGPIPLLYRQLFDNFMAITEYNLQADLSGHFQTGRIGHRVLLGIDAAQYDEDELRTGQNLNADPVPVGPIDLMNPDLWYQPHVTPGGSPGSFTRDWNVREDTFGLQIQDLIEVSEAWKVLLGVRYDHARQETTNTMTGAEVNGRSDGAWTPRIGVVYQPTDVLSIYGSYSRSFSPKTGTIFPDDPVKPEKGFQYEIGVKSSLLNDRLTATVAAYHIDREDVVVSDPQRSSYQLQVGAQRSRGVELDMVGYVTDYWKVVAAYAFTDAEVTDDTRFNVGNRLDNVAKHQASLWSHLDASWLGWQNISFATGVFRVGERAGDLDNSFDLPAYTRVDAALYYRTDRFNAALNIKNIFDKAYYENAWRRDRVMPGLPRSVFLALEWTL